MRGCAPDIAEVRQSLRSFTRPQKNISVKNVVDKVAEFYGIDEESIYEKDTKKGGRPSTTDHYVPST